MQRWSDFFALPILIEELCAGTPESDIICMVMNQITWELHVIIVGDPGAIRTRDTQIRNVQTYRSSKIRIDVNCLILLQYIPTIYPADFNLL